MIFTEKVNRMQETAYRGTILLDMDDVLAKFDQHLLDLYNAKYSDNLSPEDMHDWDMSKYVKKECGQGIYDLMRTPGFFRQLEVKDHAVEVVTRLIEKKFNILIVSDAPKGYGHDDYKKNHIHANPADDKRDWLAAHFPMIPQSNIFLGSQKFYIRGDVLIDDKPDTFLKFQQLGLECFLMDRPYNRHIQTEKRVKNLLEAEEMIYRTVR